MKNIDSQEAGKRLYKLLDEVAKGKRIAITKHGVPVALLVPAQTKLKMNPKTNPKIAAAELREFRKKHPLHGLSLRDMVTEGRRF